MFIWLENYFIICHICIPDCYIRVFEYPNLYDLKCWYATMLSHDMLNGNILGKENSRWSITSIK